MRQIQFKLQRYAICLVSVYKSTDSAQQDPEGAEITVNVEELSPAVLEEDLPAPEGPVEEPKARSEALTVPLQTPTPAPSRPNTPDSPPEGKSLGRMSSIPRNDGLERSTQEVFRDVMMAMIGQEFPNGESLDPKKLSQEEVLALLKKHHGPVQSHGEGSHTRVFKVSSSSVRSASNSLLTNRGNSHPQRMVSLLFSLTLGTCYVIITLGARSPSRIGKIAMFSRQAMLRKRKATASSHRATSYLDSLARLSCSSAAALKTSTMTRRPTSIVAATSFLDRENSSTEM